MFRRHGVRALVGVEPHAAIGATNEGERRFDAAGHAVAGSGNRHGVRAHDHPDVMGGQVAVDGRVGAVAPVRIVLVASSAATSPGPRPFQSNAQSTSLVEPAR